MPVIHKSTIKAARQAEKRRLRNRAVLSGAKSLIKKVTTAVERKDSEGAKASLREATSTLNKAVTKGVMKRNTVSRRISRLARRVNSISASQT